MNVKNRLFFSLFSLLLVLLRPAVGTDECAERSFASAVTYRVGPVVGFNPPTPHVLVTEDLDRDGNLDFATLNRGNSQIGVLKGKGDGTFSEPRLYTISSRSTSLPEGLCACDLTGDGYPELAAVDWNLSELSVFVNDGTGLFLPPVTYILPVGAHPHSVMGVDIDGDGDEDLVVTNDLGGGISVFRNDGRGSLTNWKSYRSGVRPQFAAAGVSFGFLVLPALRCLWVEEKGGGPVEGSFCFHLFFAMLFTYAALLILVYLGRRGGGSTEGRIAAGYAVAAAATILFLAGSAFGATHIDVLLKGEILAISREGLTAILVFFGLVLFLFVLFRRDFLLVAYDREAAVSLGKKVLAWDVFLYLLVGSAISVGVLTVGPLVIFGLMVIPPLAARMISFNMTSFYVFSSLVGFVTAFAGFVASYMLDWPLGPTDVVTSFALGYTQVTHI